MKRVHIQTIVSVFVVVVCLAVLFLSVRGHLGQPTKATLTDTYWTSEGPLELSPERGRFALLFSLVEDKSFQFDTSIARFTTPDLGYIDGKYVSLFAPGLSFITIPGYLFGSFFNLGQVGIYLEIALFGLLNLFLIYAIATQLGSNRRAGLLAGVTFLFATPAFAYAVSYYQHHITTSLLLIGVWLTLKYPNKLYSYAAVWAIIILSISIDYPNAVILAPLGLYTLWLMFNNWLREKKTFANGVVYLATFFAILPPLMFFGWTNYNSYGNPLQLAGTVRQIKEIDAQGRPIDKILNTSSSSASAIIDTTHSKQKTENRNPLGFFETRKLLNGFYLFLISPDRGILYFAPTLFLSIYGLVIMYRKNHIVLNLFLGIMLLTFLLYSMWGDPWGGWAFGSRYMIPVYSILSIQLALLLTQYKKNVLVLSLYLVLFAYSSYINTAGAITFNLNPPQVEILNLEAQTGKIERYSFDRNLDYLAQNKSKSFAFESFAQQYVTASQYHHILFGLIFLLFVVVLICLFFL